MIIGVKRSQGGGDNSSTGQVERVIIGVQRSHGEGDNRGTEVTWRG